MITLIYRGDLSPSRAWQFLVNGRPTNWYIIENRFNPGALHPLADRSITFNVVAGLDLEAWNIPAGFMGVDARTAFSFLDWRKA